jgi:cell division inhibitor SulA
MWARWPQPFAPQAARIIELRRHKKEPQAEYAASLRLLRAGRSGVVGGWGGHSAWPNARDVVTRRANSMRARCFASRLAD